LSEIIDEVDNLRYEYESHYSLMNVDTDQVVTVIIEDIGSYSTSYVAERRSRQVCVIDDWVCYVYPKTQTKGSCVACMVPKSRDNAKVV
jgi:cell division FtsZ-interacting protein ZapD